MKDHIIICGLGHIGFKTFELLKRAKQKVVVISDTFKNEVRWQVEEAGGVFYFGDARNYNLLIQAGIKDAKAILALTDHDMVNTTVAMDARNLNPNIKIIIRMHNSELGNHISKAIGIHQIFSTSELAAPIFARSIFENSTIAQFELNEEIYLVSEEIKIAKDKPLNTLTSLSHLVINRARDYQTKISRATILLRPFSYLRSPVFSHFRFFLFILFCVIVLAALFLKFAMSLSYVNALYFVVTTVTTVGYGDINFQNSPSALKIFGCLLMLAGAAAIAVLFSSITEIILLKRIPNVLGGRPIPKKDHVIIVGAGHIGHQIVTILLNEQVPIAIIEDNVKNRYSADINHRVALVGGYLNSRDTLERANAERAKAILVITDDDVENLSISLAARKLNPNIISIIQIFSARLADQLQSALSLDRVLSVENITAPYFAAAVFGEEILVAMTSKNKLIYLSRGTSDSHVLDQSCLILNGKAYKDIRICSIDLD